MCKKISILLLVLSLTACGTTQVAELSTTAVESKIETTTVAETTTIVETSEEIKETVETTAEKTTILDKWAGYSEEVKKIIEKYDGKSVYEMYKNISKEEKKALAEAGLYLVGLNTYGKEEYLSKDVNGAGGKFQIMTYEEAERYALDFYNKNGGELQSVKLENGNEGVLMPISYNAGEFEDLDPCINASHLYTDTKRKEVYNQEQEYLNSFVIVNEDTSSPAKYVNSLGNKQYFRDDVSGNVFTRDPEDYYKDGVWTGGKGEDDPFYKWCVERNIKMKDYLDVEELVFKKNNSDIYFEPKDTITYTGAGDYLSYKNKKYKHYNGAFPYWVERDWKTFTYDAYGRKQYPDVNKSFESVISLCGNTYVYGDVVAFQGWSPTSMVETMNKQKEYGEEYFNRYDGYTFNYNAIVEDCGENPTYEQVINHSRVYLVTDRVKENPYDLK